MIRALRTAVARFYAADGLFLASGLAFSFLLCLIPFVLLGVSMVGFVLSGEEAAQQVVNQLARNFPVYRREISRALLAIVETRRISGLLGTVSIIVFTSQLFGTARLVMHRVLGVRAGSFLGNFARDAVMVVLLSVFLFVGTVANSVMEWVLTLLLEPVRVSRQWIGLGWVGFSLAVSTLMLYFGYRYLPRRRIRPGAALAGAVLASVLWEIAKRVFRVYVRNVAVYGQLYGPLAVLVAFVMFVYYTCVVFVFGACYVAAMETRRRA
ncbi:MAG TPA: YihY/virulence factor BrkB family protein [Candidatus Acidoferrum sp.]|nr:YihY/virulence factor BrkB family protein [Candidatus Acidoferrum sp.]